MTHLTKNDLFYCWLNSNLDLYDVPYLYRICGLVFYHTVKHHEIIYNTMKQLIV